MRISLNDPKKLPADFAKKISQPFFERSSLANSFANKKIYHSRSHWESNGYEVLKDPFPSFCSFPNTIKEEFLPNLLQESLSVVNGLLNQCKEKAFLKEDLQKNYWHFYSWGQIRSKYKTIERLYSEIQKRLSYLAFLKEKFRGKIQLDRPLSDLGSLDANGSLHLDASRLSLIGSGISGSYILQDRENRPRYVIKPIDEDIGCLNNPKGYSTPLDQSPIRENMPLYRSPFREVLAYEIAKMAKIEGVVPKTVLAICESKRFSHLYDQIDLAERKRYLEECGTPEKEKLASVQEYVPNSKTLFEALQDFQAAGLSDQEIVKRFDQTDFEEANLLLWLTYDTDGHGGNFLVYPKGVDAIGNEILGIKKIDNGLAFPERNQQLRNALSHLPNAKLPISKSLVDKIWALDERKLVSLLESYEMQGAAPALRERIRLMKEIALETNITLKDFNSRMLMMRNL